MSVDSDSGVPRLSKWAERCYLCGGGKGTSNILRQHLESHHAVKADLLGMGAGGFFWEEVEGYPNLLVALRGRHGNKGSVCYCVECHKMEVVRESVTVNPLTVFKQHQHYVPTGKQSHQKGLKKGTATTAPAVGGSGVSAVPVAPVRALVVPYDWIAERTELDMEGYGLTELAKEIEDANLCRKFQKIAEAARKELEALKVATPVSTGSTGEAFTRTLTELFDARGIGKWVREKHADLKEKYEKSDGYDPEYPHEPRDTLLGIIGIAKNADTLVGTADEENIQVRREMNLMRLQMEEVQRKSLALAGIINEQAAKISELEAPMRADAAAAYAAQRAEIARSMGAPTQPSHTESPA